MIKKISAPVSLVRMKVYFLTVFILIVAVALSLLWSGVKDSAIDKLAAEEARQTSKLVFEGLYVGMRKGWDKEEIQKIIADFNKAAPNMSIRVFRGNPVIKQFGEIAGEKEIRESDSALSEVIKDGNEKLIVEKENIRYLYPLSVKQECLSCHTGANIDDINGVIDISYPINNLKVSLSYLMNLFIYGVIVLVLVLSIVLYSELHYYIIKPIRNLIRAMDDLTENRALDQRVDTNGKALEFHQLTVHFNSLLETLQEYYEQMKMLATSDSLTHLFNRRGFESHLKEEITRSKRYKHNFSLLLLDLDNFKAINDTLGHPVGDEVLIEVASVLRVNTRETDVLVRLGGDEFAVILPETETDKAMEVAEKICRALKDADYGLSEETISPSASIGVASFPENGVSQDNLILAADGALYKAKDKGKSCVIHI